MIKIKLAGLNVLIYNRYSHLEKQCRDYLSDFKDADIEVFVTDEEIAAERSHSSYDFSDGYYESVCAYRKICSLLPLFDRLMLHSAVIELNGKAVAYSGKSGVGKSTHAINLCDSFDDIRILNIDKPIVHIKNDVITVFGTPWQGKENLGLNINATLTDICFLEQANYDMIGRISRNEALSPLLAQFITPTEPNAAMKHLELVERLLNKVDFHKMYCTAEKAAAVLSYNTLFKKEKS